MKPSEVIHTMIVEARKTKSDIVLTDKEACKLYFCLTAMEAKNSRITSKLGEAIEDLTKEPQWPS